MTKKTAQEVAAGLDVDAYCDGLAKAKTEHAEQRAFFAWLQIQINLGTHPLARLAYAVPNGGERNLIVASRLKTEGVKSGVPDICWPVPRGVFAGLYIEMKVLPGGRVSETQEQWHGDLRSVGYAVAVCWSWRDARQCFLDYATGQGVAVEYKCQQP
jgi:hypothetical protein